MAEIDENDESKRASRASAEEHVVVLDGLRGVAVVLVLLFHFRTPGFEAGYLGVDVFFVVSGFVITRSIATSVQKKTFNFRDFYRRRALRLLPSLYAVLAVVLAATIVRGQTAHVLSVAETTVAAIAFAANAHLLMSVSYFAPAMETNRLLHTWSLAVEEQYYFLWPVVLVVLMRVRSRLRLIALIALTVGFAVLSERTVRVEPDAAFFLLPSRVFQLLTGALAALMPDDAVGRPRPRLASGVAGVGMLLASLVLLRQPTAFPGLHAVPPTVATALLILARDSQFVARPLRSALATGLGRISYPLYLVHWPIAAWLIEGNTIDVSPLTVGVLVLTSLLSALAVHHVIERPLRRLGKRGGRPANLALLGVGVAALALVAAAASVRAVAKGRIEDTSPKSSPPSGCVYVPSSLPYSMCRIGVSAERDRNKLDDNDYDVLLIGDSHAAHLLPGLRAMLSEQGKTGLFMTYIPNSSRTLLPVINVQSDAGGGAGVAALDASALQGLLADLHVTTVLLAGRWPVYFDGTPDFPAGFPAEYTGPGGDVPEQRDVIALGLIDTLELLNDQRVVVVGSPPYFRRDAEFCLSGEPFLDVVDADTPEQCQGLSFADQMALANPSEDALEVLSAEFGFPYVSLVRWQCARDRCDYFGADGSAYYVDDDHISPLQSHRIAEELLRPLIP